MSKDPRVMVSSLFEELVHAGWHPFDPSEECRRATDMPWMGSHLREIDRLGIYHRLLTLKLCCRFGRGTSYKGLRGKQLEAAAVLFALHQTNLRDELTPQVAEHWALEVRRWQDLVLAPANERLDRATIEEVQANPLAYEPAVTMAEVYKKSGLVDPGRDRLLMGIGRAMHEKQNKNVKRPIPTSENELPAYHQLFTRAGGSIARITDSGMIEIDPLQVKSALDALDPEYRRVMFQERREARDCRRERERKAKTRTGGQGRSGPREDPVTAAVESRDSRTALRRVLRVRLARAKPRTARWHVLRNFVELADSANSEARTRVLARRVGLDESTLREAMKDEVRAVRTALKLA